jgi:hypothetical protein
MAKIPAFFVVAAGTTTPGPAGPPVGTGTRPTTGTTISGSVLPELSTGLDGPGLTRLSFRVSGMRRHQNRQAAGALVGGQGPCDDPPAAALGVRWTV